MKWSTKHCRRAAEHMLMESEDSSWSFCSPSLVQRILMIGEQHQTAGGMSIACNEGVSSGNEKAPTQWSTCGRTMDLCVMHPCLHTGQEASGSSSKQRRQWWRACSRD